MGLEVYNKRLNDYMAEQSQPKSKSSMTQYLYSQLHSRENKVEEPKAAQQTYNDNGKWYAGEQPTRMECLGKISEIYSQDKEYGAYLYQKYNSMVNDPSSYLWNQYGNSTNGALQQLANLGFDVSQLNSEWFEDLNNRGWMEANLERRGQSNSPSAPTKKSTRENQIAYYLYQYNAANELTQKADKEYTDLLNETYFYASHPGWNLSDDEIVKKVRENFDKKYSTLSSMETYRPNPLELNHGYDWYGDDTIRGAIWQARNNQYGGNMELAMGQYALKGGNMYKPDEQLQAMLDPSSAQFQPYALGATNLIDEAQMFGVYWFKKGWTEENKSILATGTPEQIKAFRNVQKSEANADEAERASNALNLWIVKKLGSYTDPEKAKKELDKVLDKGKLTIRTDNGLEEVDLSILNKMDQSMGKNGNAPTIELVPMSRPVDYKYANVVSAITKMCEQNAANQVNSGYNYMNHTGEQWFGTERPSVAATIYQAQDDKLRGIAGEYDLTATEAERAYIDSSWSSSYGDVKEYAGEVKEWADSDVQNKIKMLKSGSAEAQASYVTSVFDNYQSVFDYESKMNEKEYLQTQMAELAPQVAAFTSMEGTNDRTTKVTIDGTEYNVNFEYGPFGYEVVSATDANGNVVDWDQFYNISVYNSEVNGLLQQYNKEADIFQNRAQSEDMTPEQTALWQQYTQMKLQLSDVEGYLESNKESYDTSLAALKEAQKSINEQQYMMNEYGIDTTDYYVADAVLSYVVGFNNYEATAWSTYNPSDLYRQAIAAGEDREKIYQYAELGNQQVQMELEDAKAAREYIKLNGWKVPQNYLDNLDRHIAKLERDAKDYEYFMLTKEKDFKALAEKGRDMEYENRPQPHGIFGWTDPRVNFTKEEYYNDISNYIDDEKDPYNNYGLRGITGMLTAQLTEDEKDIYYYLMAKGEEGKAVDYVTSLMDFSYGVLHTRLTEKIREDAENAQWNISNLDFKTKAEADQWIAENGDKNYTVSNDDNGYHVQVKERKGWFESAGQNVLAILAAPMSSIVGGAYVAYQKLSGTEFNPNNVMLMFNNFRMETTQQTSAVIADKYKNNPVAGKVVQMGYEMLRNRLDSLMQSMTLGGGFGSGFIGSVSGASGMGISAAVDAMIEAKNNGASDSQAWWIGAITFVSETFTEAIEIGDAKEAYNLGFNKEGLKAFAKNWLTKAGLSEAIGESINDLSENIFDSLIMGDKSEFTNMVWQYRLQGYSEEEANILAFQDRCKSVVRTAIMSYLSPGMDLMAYASGRAERGMNDYWSIISDRRKYNPGIRLSEAVKQAREIKQVENGMEQIEEQKHQEWLDSDIANGEGDFNYEGFTPEEKERLEMLQRAQAHNANKEGLETDWKLLDSAKNADIPTQTANVATTLDIDNTQESSDRANAAAANLSRAIGNETVNGRQTQTPKSVLNWVKDILFGASMANVDATGVKQGIIYAAIGGPNSASYQLIQSADFQNATPTTQAQMLATAGYLDAQNEAVNKVANKVIFDNRVAEAEKDLALQQVESEEKTEKLEQDVADKATSVYEAEAMLEQKDEALDQAQESLQTAKNDFLNDPSSLNNHLLKEAFSRLTKADTEAKQAAADLRTAREALTKAEAELKAANEQAVTLRRQNAMELVQQADAQRIEQAKQQQEAAEAAEKAAEEQRKLMEEIKKKASEVNNFTRLNAEEFVDQNFPNLSPEDRRHAIGLTMAAQSAMSYNFDSGVERMKFAQRFAKRFNLNVKGVNSDTINGANARIDPSTRELLINNKATQWDIMYAVLGHEITHLAEGSNMYTELADMALQIRYGDGVTWKDTLAKIAANDQSSKIVQDYLHTKKIYDESTATKSNNHSAEQILQEIVADSVGYIISGDEAALQRLAQKPNLARRIISAIKSFIRKAQGLGGEPLSQAQQVVDKLTAILDQQNANAPQAKHSLSTPITDITGEEVATELPGGTVAVDNEKFSLNTYDMEERARVRDALLNAKNDDGSPRFTKEQVDKYLDNALSVFVMVEMDRHRLDYVSTDPNKSMWKPNADYGGSLDASTLCAKRLLYQGTFDAIQHELRNTPLMPEDLIWISKLMAERGYETPCGICYVESRRKNLDDYIHKWLQEYEGEYIPRIDEVSTTDGLEKIRVEHPQTYKDFMEAMNAHGQQNNPKVVELRTEYKGEIRGMTDDQVKKAIANGGIRIQSFSDFETPHLLDMVQAIMDMSSKGLTAQAYTKVPNFAWVFGDTGIKINLSLIGKGTGLDENGNLVFDDVEGMNHEEAFRLRNRYSKNVGTIIVGINDEHIIAAMGDDRIDFIIPFHRSGWKNEERKLLHTLSGYEDYTLEQSERKIALDENGKPIRKVVTAKKDVGQKAYENWVKKEGDKHPGYIVTENNGKYTITYYDGYVTIAAADSGIKSLKPLGDKNDNGSVKDGYWDYNKSGIANAEEYLRLCAQDGRVPKFNRFLIDNGDGSYRLPTFKEAEQSKRAMLIRKGYWKTLIDGKMYDNNGVGAPQEAVQPNVNMPEAYRVLNQYSLSREQPGSKDPNLNTPVVTMENNNSLPVAHDVKDIVVAELKSREEKYADEWDERMAYLGRNAFASAQNTTLGNSNNEYVEPSTQQRDMAIDPETGETTDNWRHSIPVTDPETLEFLDEQERTGNVTKTYRTMKLLDGKLVSPKATYNANGELGEGAVLGEWQMAEEDPVHLYRKIWKPGAKSPSYVPFYDKQGNPIDDNADAYFKLNEKGRSTYARYNPYMHSSNLMINDQFTGAYQYSGDDPVLGQFVTVECLIPNSELAGEYFAERAKDPVGRTNWKKGGVAAALEAAYPDNPEKNRDVFLTRWIKPVRIVPDSEVAQHYKDLIDGTDINIPANVVTQGLRDELKKIGVPIGKPQSQQKNSFELATGEKYSLPSDYEYLSALNHGDMEAVQRMVDERAKEKGYVKAAYHGTLKGGFTVFDKSYAHVGGNSGAGFYFSSNPADSEANYSDVEGADNWFKANALADRILDEFRDSDEEDFEYEGYKITEGMPYNDVVEIAKKILTKNPQTYHVYLDPGKAYIRDFNNSTNLLDEAISSFDESAFDPDDYDSDEDYFEDMYNRKSEVIYEAIAQAVQKAFYDLENSYEMFGDTDMNKLIGKLAEIGMDYESLTWDDLVKVLDYTYIDLFTDDMPEPADGSREIARAIVEGFGYDSIEDREVSKKFNQLKNMGNAGDTVHYIMFNPDQIKLADPVTYYDDGVTPIPLSERFNEENPDIRYSLPSDDILERMIQDYLMTNHTPVDNEAFAEGLEGRNPQMSKTEGPKQRGFGQGMLQNSDEIDQAVKDYILGRNAYFPDTNAEQVARAIKWVHSNKRTADSDGFAESLQAVTSDNFNYLSADGQARTIVVAAMAAAKGDAISEAMVLDQFNREGTDLGRAFQARKIWMLMTPQGRKQSLDNFKKRVQDSLDAKGIHKNLNFSHWVYDLAESASPADIERLKRIAASELAAQIPANWKDKLRSFRMMAMLANPRTHVRNFLGNFMFEPIVGIKNKIGALLELKKPQGQKTKTLSLRLDDAIRDYAKMDAEKMKSVLTGEAKYNENTLLAQESKAFKGFLQAVSDFNSNALEAEDWVFLKRHYTRAFGGWMQANGYTANDLKNNALLEQGRAYAVLEAQKATYRDFNEFAKWLNEAGRNSKTLEGKFGAFLVDAVLPFKKTPANILRRGLEYSPVGLVKSFTYDLHCLKQYNEAIQNGYQTMPDTAITPNQWIDKIASGLTGTGIMIVGALMSSLGLVSVSAGDDDDPESAKGGQKYSIKILGTDYTYTIDWAAPASIPFFVGAAIMENHEDMNWNDVANAIAGISEPVFNLSMLDGLSSTFKTSSYGDQNDPLSQVALKIGTNYVSSYYPSLFGAINRTFVDGTRRKSYVPSDRASGPMGTVNYAIESLKNKTPLSLGSIPMRDIWGEEETSGFVERLFENFISPGYISKTKNDPILNEMSRLYDSHVEGSNKLMPGNPPKSYTYKGEKHIFSDQEYDKFFTTRASVAHDYLTQLINSSAYQNASDEAKVEMMNSVWSYAKQVGLSSVIPGYDYDQLTVGSIAEEGKINNYKSNMLTAIATNDWEGYDAMVQGLIQNNVEETQIKQWIGNKYRDEYKKAYHNNNYAEMARIEALLDNTGYDFDLMAWEEQVDKKYGE